MLLSKPMIASNGGYVTRMTETIFESKFVTYVFSSPGLYLYQTERLDHYCHYDLILSNHFDQTVKWSYQDSQNKKNYQIEQYTELLICEFILIKLKVIINNSHYILS